MRLALTGQLRRLRRAASVAPFGVATLRADGGEAAPGPTGRAGLGDCGGGGGGDADGAIGGAGGGALCS